MVWDIGVSGRASVREKDFTGLDPVTPLQTSVNRFITKRIHGNSRGDIGALQLTHFHPFMALQTRWNLSLWLAVYLVGALTIRAQESAQPLPDVTEHSEIRYVPLARQARIQGQVHLRITTDGHAVTDVMVKDGHPLLAQAAVENVRTWKFVEHTPGTFDVTFKFHFLDVNPGTFLQAPGRIEVFAFPDRHIYSYTTPEKWTAHLRNAQGTIDTPLTLWTYHTSESEMDGYATGPQGQEREFRNSHITGDMLGFDATLDDKYGERLKFSMIGKMTGDRIRGVFLSYWGVGGRWTAERDAKAVLQADSAPPDTVMENPISAADVIHHEYLNYPDFAIEAGIEGTVRLRVSTDGYSISNIDMESGNPFLVQAAIRNVRTWRFADRNLGTFEVTYDFQITTGKVEFLKEPAVVDVGGMLPLVEPIFSGGVDLDPTETWQAELTSARGNVRATMVIGVSSQYGTLEGYVIGPKGKKKEIWATHQDGEMLGFDMTVTGADGKLLKVSLLGKKSRNKITGVFLDYSGTPGTWTAVRQVSLAEPIR